MPEYQYAIIIPAWNEAQFIESTVQSVTAAMDEVPLSGQLIVVDNNSTDDTATRATAAGAQVVFEPINQIARSRNAGAAVAQAEYFVFVDADTSISAPLLLAALDALQSEEVVGGGACIRGDRKADIFTAFGIVGWNAVSRISKVAAGCFVYTRADAFHATGGFPEDRYAGEELVLSRRVRKWGKKHGMRFHIIQEHPVTTSLRKLDWYSPAQIFKQVLLVMIPGALKSKKRLNAWYDDSVERTQKISNKTDRTSKNEK